MTKFFFISKKVMKNNAIITNVKSFISFRCNFNISNNEKKNNIFMLKLL